MTYGIRVSNLSGVSLIDENSKQVQSVKSGTVIPGSYSGVGTDAGGTYNSNNPWVKGAAAPCVIMPRPFEECLLFVGAGGSNTSGGIYPLTLSVFKGTCNLTITKKSGGAVGDDYIYANLSYGSVSAVSGGISGMGTTSGLQNNSIKDVGIGTRLSAWAAYVSGYTPPSVIKIEDGGSYDVKITFSTTFNAAIPNNTAWVDTKDVAIFSRLYSENTDPGYFFNYKIGQVTRERDETADWGWEVYDSTGLGVAFSTNRVNFQIEEIVVGNPDLTLLTGAGSGSGDLATGLPIITTEVGNINNFSEYFVLVTAFGFCTLLIRPEPGDTNGKSYAWGAGYIFSQPGYSFYDNATATNNPDKASGVSSTQKSSSTPLGIAMAPIIVGKFETGVGGPSSGYSITDSWAVDATRSLIVGKFI
jgi:hypothetical protein